MNDNTRRIIADYRRSDRAQRDELWFMYLGLRAEFQKIEDGAAQKCAECGQNPHNAYCSMRKP